MPGLAERLRALNWLRLLRVAARAEVIAQAWHAAGPTPERADLWDALLDLSLRERGDAAFTALCRLSAGAGDEQLERLRAAARGRLGGVLQRLLAEPAGESPDRPDPRRVAVELIDRLGLFALSEALVPLMRGADAPAAAPARPGAGDDELSSRALMALTHLAERAAAAGPADAPRPLIRAVLRATELAGQHRRTEPAAAWALLVAAGVRVPAPAWLAEADHPGVSALRRLLRRDEREAVRAAAWVWLRHPTLAAAAAQRLRTPEPEPLAPLARQLARWPLLLNPARAAQLDKLLEPTGAVPAAVVPPGRVTAALPPAARVGLVRLIAALPMPARLADAALAGALTDDDPAVRHAAVRASAIMPGRPACLLDLCFDPDLRVARSATLAVACQPQSGFVHDAPRQATLDALTRSGHAHVAAIARLAAGKDVSTPGCGPLAQRLPLRRALARSPEAALAGLRSTLRAGDWPEREAALALVRGAGLSAWLADDVVFVLEAALGDAHAHASRVGATAAALLGGLADARSAQVLARCLAEPALPVRTRANALEAMVKRLRLAANAPGHTTGNAHATLTPDRLEALAHEPEHRLRANAIRGLFILDARAAHARSLPALAARRALVAMLRDGRVMHRAAGLWLAERQAPRLAQASEVIDAVVALARDAREDPAQRGDPASARVRPTAARLMVEVRAGWSRRAATVGQAAGVASADAHAHAAARDDAEAAA